MKRGEAFTQEVDNVIAHLRLEWSWLKNVSWTSNDGLDKHGGSDRHVLKGTGKR